MITLYNCIPMEYSECLSIQRSLNELRNDEKVGDLLIATEHEDTYTAGIHFNRGNLSNYSVPIIRVERGGSLTYHGKGQLVLYFVFNLRDRGINVKQLIEIVQKSVKDTLALYGLEGEGRMFKETGVWTNKKKICSIGFAIKEFSTLHGIAINLNTDIKKFYKIEPCDLDPGVMTSLENELGYKVDETEFFKNLVLKLSVELKEEIEIKDCETLKDDLFYINK